MIYSIDWLKKETESGNEPGFLFFWGHTPKQDTVIDKSCLSQWFASPFTVNGIVYLTAEHWMMAKKAELFNDREMHETILSSNKPSVAKELGRKVKNFDPDTWANACMAIVIEGNLHKFSQEEALKKFLLDSGKKVIEKLMSFPPEARQQIFSYLQARGLLAYYWGGMVKDTDIGTSGPPYASAIICVLAILGMFILDGKHKWWILAAVGFTIMMSWGSYFDALNGFLYKYLPMYNKFRAPSIILVVSQLLLPLLAVLCVEKIVGTSDKKTLMPAFKKGLIGVGATFGLLLLIYMMSDFMSAADTEFMQQVNSAGGAQEQQIFSGFYEGLRQDRKGLMMGDIMRSLGFGVAALALIFLAIRRTINNLVLAIGLIVLVVIDLFTIDVKYLNYDNYLDKQDNEAIFTKTQADNEILADTSYYRVYNPAGTFKESITSYHYNSIGGYHAAKIRLYQDLAEQKFSRQQPDRRVLNMLNAKYFIQKNGALTQAYQRNDSALGNCWLVKNIQYVEDARAEMNLLGTVEPADTAIVQETFKSSIPFEPVADSSASISLIKNDNDVLTYAFNAASNQFAVFSEVYYKSGWKAYIDEKEAPIVKVNYVLRGLAVPAGKHNIKFEFKPQGFYTGRKITSIFSIVLLVILIAGIFMEWRNRNQAALANRV